MDCLAVEMGAQLVSVVKALFLRAFVDFVGVEAVARVVGAAVAAMVRGPCQAAGAKATCSCFFTVTSAWAPAISKRIGELEGTSRQFTDA